MWLFFLVGPSRRVVVNVTGALNFRLALAFQFFEVQGFVPPHRPRILLVFYEFGLFFEQLADEFRRVGFVLVDFQGSLWDETLQSL